MPDPSDIAAAADLLTESLVEMTTAAGALANAIDKTNQALALLQKQPEPIPPEPEPEPPSRYDQLGVLPEARRIVSVASQSALGSALANARPGDRIEVARATYDGGLSLAVDGEPAAPIMIHAPDGATFTGLTKISGKFCGVSGITYQGDGRRIEISNAGARVLRCLFNDVDYDGCIYMIGNSHPLMLVDFCKWASCSGAAIRSEITDGSKHQDMMIAYNYFLNHSVRGDNESAVIVLMDAYHDMKFTVYRNRFQKCGIGHEKLGETELESFKTTGSLIDGNTIVDSGPMNFSLRVANKAIVQNNWLRDGAYIAVHGDDHVLQNNDAGSGKVLEFFAGNLTMDQPVPSACKGNSKAGRAPLLSSCKVGHPAPRRCLAQNNQGTIKVGSRYDNDKPVKVQQLTLVNNSHKASVVADSVSGLTERGIGQNHTTARELTAAMVGPEAPVPTQV